MWSKTAVLLEALKEEAGWSPLATLTDSGGRPGILDLFSSAG
jgi:hypothetical protein